MTTDRPFFLRLSLSLILLILSLPVWSQGNRGTNQSGIGYDPLTEKEEASAIAAALETESKVTEQGIATIQQHEILLVERHQESKELYASGEWPRRSDLFTYDYSTDTLLHTIVDVESGEISSRETIQGVQLPLTDNEIERALTIADADDALRQRLAQQYQAITGESLSSITQLNVKASIFYADAMAESVNSLAQQCGLQRCAQLLLYTADRVAFEILPIVSLSRGRVMQVIEVE
ncbi:hypothetical protein KFU94_18655 [Chloroflexi bacterium TSY]|nr:hypothetical protein [Chloroflexi bacterium TSY]